MNKDFLTFQDTSAKELQQLVARALAFKKKKGRSKILQGKVLGLIFEKESTRTRISFEVAMRRLGGEVIYMGQNSSQLARGESYADTARVLSRYLDGIVLRTFSHDSIEQLARFSSIPVINGLTDLHHPCQIMADLMTVLEYKGNLKGTIAYIGGGNNMANSWIQAACLLNFPLNVATPEGYEPDASVVALAEKCPNVTLGNDPVAAVEKAHVINTDTWFSMGQEVTEQKRRAFNPFQVNDLLLKKADKKAIVLHCLPAHRGEEITDAVMDGPQSAVFDQAENRLYVQMALLEALLAKTKKRRK